MKKYFRHFKVPGGAVVFAPLALAVLMSIFAPAWANADDITLTSSVIDSTPSATPTQFVTIPVGADTATAPIVDIQLTNLEPYSFVQVFAQSEPILIASGFADKYGVFKAKANLPTSLDPGDHTITALVQSKGETTAALKPLIRFSVTSNGVVAKPTKSSGSGGNSGGTQGGGPSAGGGDVVTQSPVATPQPTATSISIGGVLFVGGVESSSVPTYEPQGAPARVAVSVANNYTKPISLVVSFTVTNLFGQEVAKVSRFKVSSVKPSSNLMVETETKSGIGQWGFYNTKITVSPPSHLDGLNLYSVTRENSFFVWPMIPTSLAALIIVLEVLRRTLLPYFRTGRAMSADSKIIDTEEGN